MAPRKVKVKSPPSQETPRARQQRARCPEDRALKKALILRSAADLLLDQNISEISMDGLSKKAHLAKGTLYLYFKTKEEVFLELLLRELLLWKENLQQSLNTQSVQPALANQAAYSQTQNLAQTFAATLKSQPLMPRLLSHLHLVLENNLSLTSALRFKLELKTILETISQLLSEHIAGLTPQKAFIFLMQMHALTIGLYQTAHPPEAIQRILERPELQILQISFYEQLKQITLLLLQGMEAQEREQEKPYHFYSNY